MAAKKATTTKKKQSGSRIGASKIKKKAVVKKSTTKKVAAKKSTAKKATAKKATAKRSVVKKTTAKKPVTKKAAVKKSTTKKVATKKTTAKKSTSKKVSVKKKVVTTKKKVVKKTAAKKPVAKKVAVKKVVAKKVVVKKTTAKKAPIKKTVAKKAIQKKTAVKKQTKSEIPKKSSVKKKPSKKGSGKKTLVTNSSLGKSYNKPAVKAVTKNRLNPVVGIAVSRKGLLDKKQSTDSLSLNSEDGYMNSEELLYFKNKLIGWKKALMEEVDRTVSHMKDDAANFPDPNDRASLEEEFSLELRARDRERKLISKIDEALQAIRDEEYGYCEACGIEIGLKRLEARPTAAQCIDCKTLDEIREKQLVG